MKTPACLPALPDAKNTFALCLHENDFAVNGPNSRNKEKVFVFVKKSRPKKTSERTPPAGQARVSCFLPREGEERSGGCTQRETQAESTVLRGERKMIRFFSFQSRSHPPPAFQALLWPLCKEAPCVSTRNSCRTAGLCILLRLLRLCLGFGLQVIL